jgi:hypothetical protein
MAGCNGVTARPEQGLPAVRPPEWKKPVLTPHDPAMASAHDSTPLSGPTKTPLAVCTAMALRRLPTPGSMTAKILLKNPLLNRQS